MRTRDEEDKLILDSRRRSDHWWITEQARFPTAPVRPFAGARADCEAAQPPSCLTPSLSLAYIARQCMRPLTSTTILRKSDDTYVKAGSNPRSAAFYPRQSSPRR
jgi:hypothetical protein